MVKFEFSTYASSTHPLFLIVVTSFISTGLNSKINILVLLLISLFFSFLHLFFIIHNYILLVLLYPSLEIDYLCGSLFSPLKRFIMLMEGVLIQNSRASWSIGTSFESCIVVGTPMDPWSIGNEHVISIGLNLWTNTQSNKSN